MVPFSMIVRSATTILLPALLCGTCVVGSLAADQQLPLGTHGHGLDDQKPVKPTHPTAFLDFLGALDVLQETHFEVWQGVWPSAIDWTSAVLGTYLAAALETLSASLDFSATKPLKASENLVNRYFSQLAGSYFGQDAFALRQEANDDMLWVVLGWLEGIKFSNLHSKRHFSSSTRWHGSQYNPAFAHRARIFWDIASRGWNTTLCDGGMLWSPYGLPYKNAVTNELYISASVSMYLYFPGDENASPYDSSPVLDSIPPVPAHDPKYLDAAIQAYRWLQNSNMTNDQGLFVDGYHISGWSKADRANTKCDQRNEMVYTYNQGVLLSGQRGLYQATGARSYLDDGHKLVRDVIKATGWDLKNDRPLDGPSTNTALAPWRGIGRAGILEDVCDASGSCSQDGQTFKGIFYHHLTLFCGPLQEKAEPPGSHSRHPGDMKMHKANCKAYRKWTLHNAHAALRTRNEHGEFGMWWGAPTSKKLHFEPSSPMPYQAIDYRNRGLPRDWESYATHQEPSAFMWPQEVESEKQDLNDRGRGRTVETQGGGVAVLRAAWELGYRL